jgi:hypothetical protein
MASSCYFSVSASQVAGITGLPLASFSFKNLKDGLVNFYLCNIYIQSQSLFFVMLKLNIGLVGAL